MRMTRNLEKEMGYVKDLLTVLRKNHHHKGDVFKQRTLLGQPHFGYPGRISDCWYTCVDTLDAMERRGLIIPIDKVYTWGDGTVVTMENMHAGEVYLTTTYRVVIDNFDDYFEILLRQIANL